jgi:ankyrin repeat protein
MPESLPDNPNLDWLRKEAKRLLDELRKTDPSARLSTAQLEIARRHGFPSWRSLKAQIDSRTIEGQLIDAARKGDAKVVERLLDEHSDKLHLKVPPYDGTLLHVAAQHGQLAVVDLLLKRGSDPNAREGGDNTYAMHWAAAQGHLDIVRLLADAGGDVVGAGDDHQLEVIGWSAFGPHREVADFLVSRGARHHIFSAIAFDDADEVRRVIANDPSAVNRRMSRNENHQTALHFAIHGNRQEIVALLLELGADPLAVDGWGFPAAAYAVTADADRLVMERIRAMLDAELDSAARGKRKPNVNMMDLLAVLAHHDWGMADRLLRESVETEGTLHLMAKRGDAGAAKWLLEHGANPSALWNHWDAEVTPLHLAALGDHPDVARVLLDGGADPKIKDSKHDSDALGWAEFFQRGEMVQLLRDRA